MTIQKSETLAVQSDSDIVLVRQRVRAWAVEMKFSLVDQTKLVTAASELARNTVEHGHGGELCMEVVSKEVKKGLGLTFADRGPGITDLQMALKDGFSTGGGMGLGLSGSRRLVHDFDIRSTVGEGTSVTVTRWK